MMPTNLDFSSPSAFGASVLVVALGWAFTAIWDRISQSQRTSATDRVALIERWARKAAAIVLPLIGSLPSELTAQIEKLLTDNLSAIFRRVGIDVTAEEWAHALEVAHEELIKLQLQGLATGAAAVAKSMEPIIP